MRPPYLLNENDVPKALAQMRAKTRADGLLVITMRDFDRPLTDRPPAVLPIVIPGSPRRVVVRLHDRDHDQPSYTVRYLIVTDRNGDWTVKEHTRYRAITQAELTAAAEAAGAPRVRTKTPGEPSGANARPSSVEARGAHGSKQCRSFGGVEVTGQRAGVETLDESHELRL